MAEGGSPRAAPSPPPTGHKGGPLHSLFMPVARHFPAAAVLSRFRWRLSTVQSLLSRHSGSGHWMVRLKKPLQPSQPTHRACETRGRT